MANSHEEISSSSMKQFSLCLSWVRELIPQVMKLQVAMTHLHSPYSRVAEGELGVTQKGRHLRRLLPGDVFGELAVLYNCQRTATVMGKEGIVMCVCLSKFSAANVSSKFYQPHFSPTNESNNPCPPVSTISQHLHVFLRVNV